MKKTAFLTLFLAGGLLPAQAEYLYNGYLVPSQSTDYYGWGSFSHAYGTGNEATTTFIGVDVDTHPTITQFSTTAFLAGDARIYNIAEASSFSLENTVSYTLGTVAFQFQTAGSLPDFSSIELVYTSGGIEHSLTPDQFIREFKEDGAVYGFSVGNRSAVQWDLTGLNISSYEIRWEASSASMSLQSASIDTAASWFSIVPEARTWQASGSGLWSNGANWEGGQTSVANGNVYIDNQSGAASVSLDSNRTVGELIFRSANDVSLTNGGGALTLNTGISTEATATGTYNVGANVVLNAYSQFDIEAGTVQIDGTVSGSYGIFKKGDGTLVLAGDNSFGKTGGSLAVDGGTLRIEGTNQYTGATTIAYGTLELAADAPSGSVGALGKATGAVVLGQNSNSYVNIGDLPTAALILDGDYTVGRSVTASLGTFKKVLGAQNTVSGATFSGIIKLAASAPDYADNVYFQTAATSDKLFFTNKIEGGTKAVNLYIDGPGRVIFTGNDKTYQSSTTVKNGTLEIGTGIALTGTGNMSVNAGANLIVNGTLQAGSNALLNLDGRLGGTGTVARAFTVADGAILSPGEGIGELATVDQVWGAGGVLELEIGATTGDMGMDWDGVQINGSLSLTATESSRFILKLSTLSGDAPGALAGFDSEQDYHWKILTVTGDIVDFDPTAFEFETTDFLNLFGGEFSLSLDEHDLILNYAVPEPSTYALFGAGVVAFALLRRRRRKAA